MKKWKYFLLAGIIVVVALVVVFLYMDFYKETKKNNSETTEVDYREQFRDETNVEEVVEPVKLSEGVAEFNECKNSELLSSAVDEIKTILAYEPGQNLEMSQVEEVAGARFDSLFEGYTLRIIGSAKTNLKHTGYCVQTQKKAGLGQSVNVIVTSDRLMRKVENLPRVGVKVSDIFKVPVRIYYNHSVRNSSEEKEAANRYFYEAVFEYNGTNYYISTDFSGYNRELEIVETTKEETSKEFAEFVQKFIVLLRKDS